MKITRHIHYLENPTTCIRHEFKFDPPYELKSTLGKVDPIYPGFDFSKGGNRARLTKVEPIINKNGLLHIRELMNAGEVLSIELRVKHRLDKITLDDAHQLEILAGDNGLLYWINVGKTGALVVTGKLIPDIDRFFQLLKTNLTDPAVRNYIKQRSVVDGRTDINWSDLFPDVMNIAQAAVFLGLAESTVYKKAQSGEIPRNRNKKYLKVELDLYRRRPEKRRYGR